jgi:predicted ATPase/class 3 adenylate cyclase
MADLPTGTVTFVFTDVEGSTQLLKEIGAEAYADALAEHRRLIRDACADHGGVEVDTQGDAFFFAFPTAPGALAAAAAFTEALADGPVQVRVGIHTGTPLVTDEGYVGIDVHRAARIAAAGHGGQVLVATSTAALLDVDLVDLGEHRFKDLAAPERVFQLGGDEFPPLRSLYRTNLPVPANPLVGRKQELVDVLGLLQGEARVVTVLGPGGVGKTRFALATAAEAADAFPDGSWFVDLSPVRDPQLVLPTVAHVLGADGDLRRHLRDAECLLLIDNFEQVVDAAADLAPLVSSCPGVRVLVTSREPLRIAAEREYPLRPLSESPAVELLRHRAGLVAPDVVIDYDVAAQICDALDRLPLAIELAAARVRVLEPPALLERLEDRLPLLVTRARDMPERQRGLHATIAWSYELLDDAEQRLFRALAVFRGGATLDAIEVVTGAGPDLVESLVDKSLVRHRRGRFVMLETIREFGREQLDARDESVDVRRRHAEHFAKVAEETNLNAGALRPGGQRLDVAIAEQDNVRAALSSAIGAGDLVLGVRVATAMEQFWVVNDPEEGRRWFAELLARPAADTVPPELLAQAYRAYGSATDIAGDFELARELYEQSLALHEQLGDEHGRAVQLHRIALIEMRGGDLARARELVQTSHAIHEANANVWGLAQTIGTLGAIERDGGDADRAYELVARSAALAAEAGVPWWHAGMLVELGALSLEADRVDDAAQKATQALELARRMHDYGGRVFGVGVLACVALARGDPERAGLLWGAIEDERVGAPLGGWIRHRAACEARIETAGSAALEEAVARGRDLTLDEAVDLALRP